MWPLSHHLTTYLCKKQNLNCAMKIYLCFHFRGGGVVGGPVIIMERIKLGVKTYLNLSSQTYHPYQYGHFCNMV